MTNKEAIRILSEMPISALSDMTFEEIAEALQLASKALENEPITEERAIDYLRSTGWLQEHDKVLTKPKKGEWVLIKTNYDDGGNNLYECTHCHHSDTHSGSIEVPYCWYCGADMMEVDNEQE